MSDYRPVPPQVDLPTLEHEVLALWRDQKTFEKSLDRAADEEVREIDLIQKMLHDDLAELVYEKLRRRPMVLPVVVEV